MAALPLFVATTWLWHVPPVYELALRSSGWHYLQHVCFLGAALLFWYPVVRPYPSRPRWSPWLLLPYLILADVSEHRPVGPADVLRPRAVSVLREVPRLGGLSALDDQSAAGVLMWVPGSAGLSAAAVRDRRPAAVRPEASVRSQRRQRSRSESRVRRPLPGRIALAAGAVLL